MPHSPVGTEGGNAATPIALAAVPAAHSVVPACPPSLGDPGLIREAVDLLARAERPLIVAGSGVFYAGAEEALRSLADATGFPVVTPIWDRGAVSRPMAEYLGVIGAASGGPAVLADADMILLIGSRVDYRVGYLKPPAVPAAARVVRTDRDPAELGQGVLPDVGILGDPALVLHQLWEEWLRRHLQARAEWLRQVQERNRNFRARWARSPGPGPMTGHHLIEGLGGLLTDETIFLIDGGNIGQWAHVLLWDRYPGHWLTCGASAVVGWGLPAAIGAKLLYPTRPVLLLSGDGAIGFTITELETAVRHRAPIVVVVADDEAWGIVASDQKNSWGEPIASLLGPVDYARVAQGFGAAGGYRVTAGPTGSSHPRGLRFGSADADRGADRPPGTDGLNHHWLEAGGFGSRLKARLCLPCSTAIHTEIVVFLGYLLGLDLLHDHFVGHVSGTCDEETSGPEVPPQQVLFKWL